MTSKEQNTPLISVIIPAYNVAACIERTLNNVLQQTWKALEIIVVNDGSSDDTGAILDRYAAAHGAKIRVIHTPNQGVTCARLTGVKHAAGEWIGFVDGDDLLDQDMYELLIGNALRFRADISHCGYQMEFEDGRIRQFHGSGVLLTHDRCEGLVQLLNGTLVEPSLCNKLYRRSLFDHFFAQNRMDLSIKQTEDLLMNFLLFDCADRSVFQDVCKYRYTVRAGSATRTALNDSIVYDPLRVRKLILENASEDIRRVAQATYIDLVLNSYNMLAISQDTRYRHILPHLRQEILTHWDWISMLGKKRRILALLLKISPFLHKAVYRTYVKHFQENAYE